MFVGVIDRFDQVPVVKRVTSVRSRGHADAAHEDPVSVSPCQASASTGRRGSLTSITDYPLVYMHSNQTRTMPGSNGAALTLHSRGMTLWRREADGQRRCAVDM